MQLSKEKNIQRLQSSSKQGKYKIRIQGKRKVFIIFLALIFHPFEDYYYYYYVMRVNSSLIIGFKIDKNRCYFAGVW